MPVDAYQWKAWIGPRLRSPTDTFYFDWSNFTETNLEYYQRVTASRFNLFDQLFLTSAFEMPETGGLWVYPVGTSTEKLEYVEYNGIGTGSEMLGVFRQDSSSHAAGSSADLFYPVAGDDGALSVDRISTDDFSVRTWKATFSGKRAPYGALRPGHIIYVQRRRRVSADDVFSPFIGAPNYGWQDWENHIIGVIESVNISDDSKRESPFSLSIVPIVDHYSSTKIKGVRIGSWDISDNASASSSQPLPTVAAFKERDSGDFTAAAPSFSAQNVLDTTAQAPWIGNRFLGGYNPSRDESNDLNEYPKQHASTGFDNQQYNAVAITQVYLNTPPGLPKGYRWIEVTAYTPSITNLTLINNDHFANEGVRMRTKQSYFNVPTGAHIIICENRSRFEEMNPDHGAFAITSAEEREFGENIFDYLNPERDGLVLLATTNQQLSLVLWGGQVYDETTFRIGEWGTRRTWVGPTLPPMLIGQAARYQYNPPNPTQSRDYWSVDYIHTPGYDLPGYDREGVTAEPGNENVPYPWLRVELPGIGLSLRSDVAVNADTLTLQDESGELSTNGLPTSGTVQIGETQIAYTGKSNGTLTGCSGVDTPHTAGDLVYLLVDSQITDAHPIEQIEYVAAPSGIRPEVMEVSLSSLPLSARSPVDDGWENDYFFTDSNYAWGSSAGIFPLFGNNQRVKTHLTSIKTLNTNGADRPRISGILYKVNRDSYDTEYWLAAGDVGTVVSELLQRVGIPAGIITSTGVQATLDGEMTATTAVSAIIQDALSRNVARMTVNLDSTIDVSPNDFWATTFHTTNRTWSESNLIDIKLGKANPNKVSQVLVEYELEDGTTGVEVYPDTDRGIGQPVEIGPIVVANAGDAGVYAHEYYQIANWQRTVTVKCAYTDDGIWPGDYHAIEWDFNDKQPGHDHSYIVESVTDKYTPDVESGGVHLLHEITLLQIDSEAVD